MTRAGSQSNRAVVGQNRYEPPRDLFPTPFVFSANIHRIGPAQSRRLPPEAGGGVAKHVIII